MHHVCKLSIVLKMVRWNRNILPTVYVLCLTEKSPYLIVKHNGIAPIKKRTVTAPGGRALCGRWIAGTAGSNLVQGLDVLTLGLLCFAYL
jgi:hypothetical protein